MMTFDMMADNATTSRPSQNAWTRFCPMVRSAAATTLNGFQTGSTAAFAAGRGSRCVVADGAGGGGAVTLTAGVRAWLVLGVRAPPRESIVRSASAPISVRDW